MLCTDEGPGMVYNTDDVDRSRAWAHSVLRNEVILNPNSGELKLDLASSVYLLSI